MSLSRRTFLFGLSAAGLGAAASGALIGCSNDQASNAQAGQESSETPVDVITTDVVIVGSGIAGLTAAKAAMQSKLDVLIVDKGPFGRSGASGINWGHGITTTEYADDEAIANMALAGLVIEQEGMCNQEYMLAMLMSMKEAALCKFAEDAGSMPERLPDGTPAMVPDASAPLQTMMGVMPRFIAQALLRRGLQYIDRTMVVDVALSDDGKAAGVIAINLATGKAVVVRAKSVVFAMGNYMWANGWGTAGAITNTGPEDTGDAYSIMLKHGIKVSGMEHAYFCPFEVYPSGARAGNSSYCCPGVMWWEFGDANGVRKSDPLMAGDPPVPSKFGCQPQRLQAKVKQEEGAIYTFPYDVVNENIPLYTRRAKEDIETHYGYELPKALEISHAPCSTASIPEVDLTGETPLENLYWAGGGETGWLGNLGTGSVGSGHMAGKGAVARAESSELPSVDWEYASEVLQKSFAYLDTAGKGEIRPVIIMHAIQKVMYESWGQLICDEALIQSGIDELNRIKSEDIPKMSLVSNSPNWNIEWRQAMEIEPMWDCVMGTLQASLTRTETRGCHIRTDYPSLDNESWLKDVFVGKDGEDFTTETRDIVDTYIPLDTVRELIAADSSLFD